MIFLWRIGLAVRFYGTKWERFSPRSDVLILRCWPLVIAWHRNEGAERTATNARTPLQP